MLKSLIVFTLLCGSLFADPINTAHRRFISAAMMTEWTAAADADTAAWQALEAVCVSDFPYNSSSVFSQRNAMALTVMYVIDRQPCGGTRANYADYALSYIRDMVQKTHTGSSNTTYVHRKVTAFTNDAQPTLTLESNHGLTVSTSYEFIIAGGTGTHARYNNRYTVLATAADQIQITACSTGANATAPCHLDATSVGALGSQNIFAIRYASGYDGANQARWYGWKTPFVWDSVYAGATQNNTFFALRAFLMWYGPRRTINGVITGANIGSNLQANTTVAGMYACVALGGEYSNSGTWTVGDTTDYPDPQDCYDVYRALVTSIVLPELTTATSRNYSGFTYEGPEYGPQALIAHVRMMEAITYGTGEDGPALFGGYWNRAVLAWIYMTNPALGSGSLPATFPYSDTAAAYLNKVNADTPKALRMLVRYADATEAGYTQHWLNTFYPSGLSGTGDPEFDEFSLSATATPIDYTAALPLAHHIDGIDMVSARSSWTSGASWFVGQSCCNQYGSHNHAHAGQFALYRGGNWLVREAAGYETSVTVNIFQGGAHPVPIYERTQQMGDYNGNGSFSLFSTASAFTFARTDFTNNYRYSGSGATGQKVSGAYRDFLYLSGDLLVVNDWAEYSTAGYAAWTSITLANPTINSNKFTATVGSHTVDATVLTPSATLLSHTVVTNPIALIKPGSPTEICTALGGGNFSTAMVGPLTISGGTGDWAALNGSQAITNFLQNTGRRATCMTVAVDSTAFASPQNQNLVVAEYAPANPQGYWNNHWRVLWRGSGSATNHSSQVVYVMRNSGDAEVAPAAVTVSAGSFNGGRHGQKVWVLGKATSPGLPSYTYAGASGTTEHIVGPLTPSTTYACTKGAGSIAISAGSGCGTTDAAGMLSFTNSEGGSPSIALNVSPSTLNFSAQEGGANPSDQTITFGSSGGTLDNFSVSSDEAHCTPTPASGTAAEDIDIAVDITGLAAGSHPCVITIASTTSGVTNSPRTVNVSVTVDPAPTNTLSLTVSLLSFTYTQGQSNPSGKTSDATATATATDLTITKESGGAWLEFSPSTITSTLPGTITVSPNPTGLDPGEYIGSLRIACTTPSECSNGPLFIEVELVVSSASISTARNIVAVSSGIVLDYVAPDADACQLQASQLQDFSALLYDVSDGGGVRVRRAAIPIDAFAQDTAVYVRALCDAVQVADNVTVPVPAGASTVAFEQGSGSVPAGATQFRLAWGYTASLTETPVTMACTGSCVASPDVLRDRVVFYRREFLDAMDGLVKSSGIRFRAIQ